MKPTEDETADAIEFAHKAVVDIVGMIDELQAKVGKKKVGEGKPHDPALLADMKSKSDFEAQNRQRHQRQGRPQRRDQENSVDEVIFELAPVPTDPGASGTARILAQKDKAKQIRAIFSEIEEEVTRHVILEGVRPDGRGFDDIRPITCAVDVLPRVHGSAVFTRGETQSMCTITLGTSSR